MATSGAQHGPRFRKAAPLKAKEEETGSTKDKKKAEKQERLVITRPAPAVATEHNRSTPSPLASGRKIVNRKEPARKHSRNNNNKERSGKGYSEEGDDEEDEEDDEEEDEDDTEESDKGEGDLQEETTLEAGEELDDPDEDKKASNGQRVTQKAREQRRVVIAKTEGKARWSRSRSARSNPRGKREEQTGHTSPSPTPPPSSAGSSPRLPTATSSPSIAGRSTSTTSRTSSRRTASPNTSEARKNRKGQHFVFNENETEGGSAPPAASSVSTQEQTPSAPSAARRPKRGEVVAIKVGKDDGEIKAEEEKRGAALTQLCSSSSTTSPTKKISWYNVRRRRSEHIASTNVVKDGSATATVGG